MKIIINTTSPIPKYYQLQTWLVEQIEQGVYAPGDKIPTEEEITQMTGLARATISQAIKNLHNDGYLTRKRGHGSFVTERDNPKDMEMIIAVMVHDIRSGYAPEFLRGIGDEADKNNYSILLCNHDDLHVRAEYHSRKIIDLNPGGIIYIPTVATDDKNIKIIETFLNKNFPLVIADRTLTVPTVDSVSTDNFEGAYQLTKHILELGHKNIAFFQNTQSSSEKNRLAGYKKALSDYGIDFNPDIVVTPFERYVEKRCYEYARHFLKDYRKYSALFADTDKSAVIFATVAKEMGIRIPQDLSIVGYGNMACNYSSQLSITTIHQPVYEMGKQCLQFILSRIQGYDGEPRHVELESRLVKGNSVYDLTTSVIK